MSIRRNLVAYLALFVVLGGTSYAAIRLARVRRTCYPPGTSTIVQNKVGRFYSSGSQSVGESWYVCAFKRGTSWKLVLSKHGPPPYPFDAKVSGRYVAFWVGDSRGPSTGPVKVIDMVTGRSTFSETTGDRFASLVLKANASVAWITTSQGNFGPWEVSRHDSTGTAVVGSGSRIEPGSLAAGGSWLYWTNAGSPRSAPFH